MRVQDTVEEIRELSLTEKADRIASASAPSWRMRRSSSNNADRAAAAALDAAAGVVPVSRGKQAML